jgi:hypothetical protein
MRTPAQIAADLERYAKRRHEYSKRGDDELLREAAQALRAQPTVTDAMVEAAAVAIEAAVKAHGVAWTTIAREALTAALRSQPTVTDADLWLIAAAIHMQRISSGPDFVKGLGWEHLQERIAEMQAAVKASPGLGWVCSPLTTARGVVSALQLRDEAAALTGEPA